MLKKFRFLTLSFLVFLFVYGCSDVQETNKGEFKADKSDFEENLFTNRQNQTIGSLIDNEIIILGSYNKQEREKTSLDDIISKSSESTGDEVEITFKNAEITTKGDKYYITADNGLSLVFRKVGDRIIEDEEGQEYYTAQYPED
ncbi:hypothetical protein H9636_06805 [Ureibacillus sp. Re31]|uniref:Lipoprotein n=1 Tax=Ureibacillus galli TaxID=2762222 RepID=A0ABR8XAN1_9BACL|nr:hypothetical protein [Ureibacillus galli]MBD8026365.1 hypothetical protein [Ureibacillus galli]